MLNRIENPILVNETFLVARRRPHDLFLATVSSIKKDGDPGTGEIVSTSVHLKRSSLPHLGFVFNVARQVAEGVWIDRRGEKLFGRLGMVDGRSIAEEPTARLQEIRDRLMVIDKRIWEEITQEQGLHALLELVGERWQGFAEAFAQGFAQGYSGIRRLPGWSEMQSIVPMEPSILSWRDDPSKSDSRFK